MAVWVATFEGVMVPCDATCDATWCNGVVGYASRTGELGRQNVQRHYLHGPVAFLWCFLGASVGIMCVFGLESLESGVLKVGLSWGLKTCCDAWGLTFSKVLPAAMWGARRRPAEPTVDARIPQGWANQRLRDDPSFTPHAVTLKAESHHQFIPITNLLLKGVPLTTLDIIQLPTWKAWRAASTRKGQSECCR